MNKTKLYYDVHIILDLEMNPVSKQNKILCDKMGRETIQIGAVKLNSDFEEIDRFECKVKPQYNSIIERKITRLTKIKTEDVENAESFEVEFDKFIRWIGDENTHARIYSWSNADLEQLTEECKFKNIEFPKVLHRWIDVQRIYPRMMCIPYDSCKQMRLSNAVTNFTDSDFQKSAAHSALYDAMQTVGLVVPLLDGSYKKEAEKNRSITAVHNEPMCTIGSDCPELAMLLSQLNGEFGGSDQARA